jgi:hypothetical protein
MWPWRHGDGKTARQARNNCPLHSCVCTSAKTVLLLTPHNTQQIRIKQNSLSFIHKDTQPSQTSSGGHITPNPTQIDAGDASLLMGSIN